VHLPGLTGVELCRRLRADGFTLPKIVVTGQFHALIADGNGLVALSYRGYGGSIGSPTDTSMGSKL
jgi:hypothetical protein